MEQDYLPLFRSVGMGTTIWSPLAAGFLSGKYLNGIPKDSRFAMPGYEWLVKRWLQEDRLAKTTRLDALAKRMGVSLPALAIAWTVRDAATTTTAILGATKKEQLLENLKALEVLPMLTPAVLEEIEEILGNKPILDLQ
jgi:aryl-alcohol dehydrogenase-like predicted oxidoreductase